MKNITVFISSFLGRGHRWQLVALVALFFVAGCTVELYPPAQEVSDLPDGGKVDVLPDTIPEAFAFGPRIFWSQIIASDSSYSIAVTDANNKGRWLDSLRWVPSGPFVTVNGDTLSTRAYARDNSGVTGDNQVLTYNGSGSLTIEDGNTVDMSDLLDNTDAQTIDTLTLQGDTMLQMSLSGDGAPVKELDLSALKSVVDSTRLTQDSILVYYQDGAEVGRDTIVGTGTGGGGGTITLSGDVTGSGTTAITTTIAPGAVGADELASTAVTPGSYTAANITVDADGRITSAANGSGGGGGDNLGDHIMTQNLQTNGNWISGDGDNEGIGINASGRVGIGTNTPSSFYDLTIKTTNNFSNIFLDKTGTTGPAKITAYHGGSAAYGLKLEGSSGAVTSIPNGYLFSLGASGSGIAPTINVDRSIMTIDPGTYNPTSGSTRLSYFSIQGIINQTGTANGITRGIWVNPTFTSVAQWRALDIPSNVGHAIYQGGTADNYFAGKIGLGTTTPSYILDINSTDAIRLPVGTTAQRPTGANGLIRFSSTNNKLEAYYNAQWNTIASEGIEDDGSASDTTDGSGDITVSHTLGSASIAVTATTTGTTFYHIQVHTKTSTTFKIRFFDATGAAVTATAVTADWIAKLQ